MADPIYLIAAGVRRAVAARELGLSALPAVVIASDGTTGSVFDVPLEGLYSPKDRISRSGQGGRYDVVEKAMADPAIRPNILPLELAALRPNRAKYFTHLPDVVLDA